jgi:hypothetical protein
MVVLALLMLPGDAARILPDDNQGVILSIDNHGVN